jgi:serine/threonine-protein kinase
MSGASAGDDLETVSARPERKPAFSSEIPVVERPSGTWRLRTAEAFAPDTVVDGHFRILERVGEGAMGVVLRAHDLRLDRDVAIKVIRPAAIERPDARERFLAEARAMARVRHPNVVEVYTLGEWLGLPYLVMEYVNGMTLAEWLELREGRPPSLDEALGVLDQLLLGVEAIHASGAAHRDLKPGNVLVGTGFRVAVTDLGISRRFLETRDLAALGSGTPLTMAPEVVLGTVAGAHALERVDVYALGVLAYRLLVGRYPFEARDSRELMAKHVSERPPPPRALQPELPTPFEPVLLAALEKAPALRTPTVAAFRAALLAAREAARRPTSAHRFLVADDDDAFRGFLAQLLLRGFPGATVEQVPDGARALAAAERSAPHALITDLDMPGMTGLELTASLRANPRLTGIPVVVVTGNGTPADWRALTRVGADAYLVKPFDAAHAVALLRALVDRPRIARET